MFALKYLQTNEAASASILLYTLQTTCLSCPSVYTRRSSFRFKSLVATRAKHVRNEIVRDGNRRRATEKKKQEAYVLPLFVSRYTIDIMSDFLPSN